MRGDERLPIRPVLRDGPRAGALALACLVLACAAPPPALPPVPAAAAERLYVAREAWRTRNPGWREDARRAAREARDLEPEWIAPRRLLDELAREDLRGPEALARHLAGLQQGEAGDLLYLAGRLEGDQGTALLERAPRLAPRSAWAHHGRAWARWRDGRHAGAVAAERRAVELARDPWERAFFRMALARFAAGVGDLEGARAILVDAVDDPELAPGDAREVRRLLVRMELASDDRAVHERGFWRGTRLLRDPALPEGELVGLVLDLCGALEGPSRAVDADRLEAALGVVDTPARARLRAALRLARGDDAWGALPGPVDPADPAGRTGLLLGEVGRPAALRRVRFARGETRAVMEEWLAALPAQAKDDDGLPVRAELAALVEAARAQGDDVATRFHLGQLMLEAGWFEEARGLAAALAPREPELARQLDAAGAEGRALLLGIVELLQLVDAGLAYGGPLAPRAGPDGDPSAELPDEPRPLRTLEELLRAMEPLLRQHLGDAHGAEASMLARSPSLRYGPFARIVHPGPTFSAADERAGRGRRGEPVPGLAAVLASLGRFGIFGEARGPYGPDGTLLRLLHVEPCEGEHLGVPFAGSVAWCEGADLPSRPGRLGARVGGAALHEGYWIDVEIVRAEHRRWTALEEGFFGEPDAGDDGRRRGRAARALATRGPGARGPLTPEIVRGGSPVDAPLGEAERVRLAVLRDRRAAAPGDAPAMSLEELLEVTARHEEGHLTDRTRFLPLGEHPWKALGLLASEGFSPARVARRLEYRAQLVCLAVADDPRVPLAQVLDTAEPDGGADVHARAYRDLLADLLGALAERVEDYPALDPGRRLVHQLHRLAPEEVRGLARELAAEEL